MEAAQPGEPEGYRERDVDGRLASHVRCTWVAPTPEARSQSPVTVLPDACLDLVWDGDRLFVTGPDTAAVSVAAAPDGAYVGLRFRIGRAPCLLGVPADVLRDQRIDAGELLGPRAAPLVEALRLAGSPWGAACALERSVSGWLAAAAPLDPVVEGAVAALSQGPSAMPVAGLAARLGVSERRLLRCCTHAVGYGPKMLHRVLRFQRFLRAGLAPDAPGLAQLAVMTGYADQAHLSRDCRLLGELPPARLLASR